MTTAPARGSLPYVSLSAIHVLGILPASHVCCNKQQGALYLPASYLSLCVWKWEKVKRAATDTVMKWQVKGPGVILLPKMDGKPFETKGAAGREMKRHALRLRIMVIGTDEHDSGQRRRQRESSTGLVSGEMLR